MNPIQYVQKIESKNMESSLSLDRTKWRICMLYREGNKDIHNIHITVPMDN